MVVGDREVARMIVGAKAENQRKGACMSCPSYPTNSPLSIAVKNLVKYQHFILAVMSAITLKGKKQNTISRPSFSTSVFLYMIMVHLYPCSQVLPQLSAVHWLYWQEPGNEASRPVGHALLWCYTILCVLCFRTLSEHLQHHKWKITTIKHWLMGGV